MAAPALVVSYGVICTDRPCRGFLPFPDGGGACRHLVCRPRRLRRARLRRGRTGRRARRRWRLPQTGRLCSAGSLQRRAAGRLDRPPPGQSRGAPAVRRPCLLRRLRQKARGRRRVGAGCGHVRCRSDRLLRLSRGPCVESGAGARAAAVRGEHRLGLGWDRLGRCEGRRRLCDGRRAAGGRRLWRSLRGPSGSGALPWLLAASAACAAAASSCRRFFLPNTRHCLPYDADHPRHLDSLDRGCVHDGCNSSTELAADMLGRLDLLFRLAPLERDECSAGFNSGMAQR